MLYNSKGHCNSGVTNEARLPHSSLDKAFERKKWKKCYNNTPNIFPPFYLSGVAVCLLCSLNAVLGTLCVKLCMLTRQFLNLSKIVSEVEYSSIVTYLLALRKRHAADPPNFVMNLPILAYMLIFNWYNRNRLPNNRPACTAWNSPIRPSGLKSSPKVQLICTSTFDLSLSKGPAKACSPKSESIVLLRAIVKPRRVHEGYSQNVTALGSVEILRATYRLGETLFTFPVYRAFSRQSAGVGLRAFKLHWPVTISTSALVNNYKGLYVLPLLNTGKFCASLTPNSGFSRSSAGGDSMETDLTSLIPLMVIDSIDPLSQIGFAT
ncbi:UDP-N-acetylmuramoylalanine--D-glutamate ligase [Trichinella pseudospiralis]